MQNSKTGDRPFETKRCRGSALKGALLFALSLVVFPNIPADLRAQEMPKTIVPPEVVSDPNGLNLMTGKIMTERPEISIPAAPRLAYSRYSDFAMSVVGQRNNGTKKGFYAVSYGNDRSANFECNDGFCEPENSHSGFAATTLGQSWFTEEKTGIRYDYNARFVQYTDPTSNIIHTEFLISKITYPDGEVINFTHDTYTDNNMPPGQKIISYRIKRATSNVGYFLEFNYWDTYGITAKDVAVYASDAPTTPLAKLQYSTDGKQVTDLLGRTWTCDLDCSNSYGNSPWITSGSVKLPGESSAAISSSSVPGSAFLTQSVNRDGATWTYSYSGVASQYVVGLLKSYKYESITVTDPASNSSTYQIKTQDLGSSAQNRYRINYVESFTDPVGRKTDYFYESYKKSHRIIGIVSPEGDRTNFEYDALGNITKRTDKAKPGSGLADLVQLAGYDGSTCSGVTCWLPIWYRDARSNQTDFIYNSHGQLLDQTDPADALGVRRKTINEYQNFDTGAGIISRRTATRTCGIGTSCGVQDETRTEFEYWNKTFLPSRERRVDPATGEIIETLYSYDAAGRLLSVDGPLPGSTDTQHFRYDLAGRRTWEIGKADDSGNRLASITTFRNADNKVTQVQAGNVASAAAPSLSNVFTTTDNTYDTRRNLKTTAVTGSGQSIASMLTHSSYDSLNRPECTAQRMNPAVYGSLPASACTLGTEGSFGPDRITKNVYDAAGQLTKVQKVYGTPLQEDYATYTYSLNGKRTSLTDARGYKASMTYDGHDRQVKWNFPSPTTPGVVSTTDYEQYGYDANGNRTSLRKRDGSVITYQYDALNRNTVKIVPERAGLAATHTRDVHYGYDLRGLQTYARFDSAAAASEGLTTAYDGLGRMTSSALKMDGVTRTLAYSHDKNGNRIQLTWPDTAVTTYAYDGLDRMVSAQSGAGVGATTFHYNNRGLKMFEVGALWSARYYDNAGRLIVIHHDPLPFGGPNFVAYMYDYNPAGQIATSIINNDAYVWTEHYNVDRTYTANGLNQYTSAGPATFAYDANGNLTSDGSTSYVYDIENRLVSASGATNATLRYDPLGRLYETVGGGNTTRFLYDGDELVAEYDGSGTTLRRYMHGTAIDDPIVWYEGSGISASAVRRLRTNHQGSVVLVSDNDGAIVNINAYDEYGIPKAGNLGRFQYTGQAWLPELGMYHYKARIYSPTLGRFLQTDPIGYEDQVNLYTYVGNDPVNRVDPTGEAGKLLAAIWKVVKHGGNPKKAGKEFVADVVDAGIELIDGDLTIDDAAAAFDLVSPVSTKEVKAGADAVRKVGKLPKPPSGKGSVPKDQRDLKRSFSPTERAAKRDEQGGQCATGCETKIDEANSEGHHITRHADGGLTTSDNHAEVCKDCHRKLHGPD